MAKANQRFMQDTKGTTAMADIAVAGILVIIAFVIVLTFLPLLNSSVATAQADPNGSASTSTLLGLIPFIVVAGLLIGAVVFLVQGVQKLRA